MAWTALLLATVLIGLRGWLLLLRQRVYSVLLLVLAFFGLSFVLSYPTMDMFDPTAAERAAWIFTAGTVVLLASFQLLERLFLPVLRRAPEAWAWRFRHLTRQHLIYSGLFLIGSLAIFLLFRADYGATWEDSRASTGPLLVIAPFLMFLGCPGIVSAWRSSKGVFAVFVCLVGIVFVFSGSRAGVLTAMAMYAWYWLTERRRIMFNLRVIGGFALITVAVFAVHTLLRGLRSFAPAELAAMLWAGDIGEIGTAITYVFVEGGLGGSESGIVQYLVYSARVADENVYGLLTSVQRVLTLFIPGSYFPDKPTDVTYLLHADAFTGGLFDDSPFYEVLAEQHAEGVMGSLHPTLFGELFLSGEWVSLFVGVVFFAGVCMTIELLLLKLRPVDALLLLGPTMVGMAMIARGNSVIGVGYFFYLLPIVLVTTTGTRVLAAILKQSQGVRQGLRTDKV